MRKIAMFLFCLATVFTFVGCFSDDDDIPSIADIKVVMEVVPPGAVNMFLTVNTDVPEVFINGKSQKVDVMEHDVVLNLKIPQKTTYNIEVKKAKKLALNFDLRKDFNVVSINGAYTESKVKIKFTRFLNGKQTDQVTQSYDLFLDNKGEYSIELK